MPLIPYPLVEALVGGWGFEAAERFDIRAEFDVVKGNRSTWNNLIARGIRITRAAGIPGGF